MPKSTFYNLAIERRLLIASVALEEFSKHPFYEASVATIIERLSIARGTFYKYFTDLRELYLYLYCETHLREEAVLAQILQTKKKPMKAYLLYFDTMLEELFDELHAYRRMVRLSMNAHLRGEIEAYRKPELQAERLPDAIRWLADQVLLEGLKQDLSKEEIRSLFLETIHTLKKD